MESESVLDNEIRQDGVDAQVVQRFADVSAPLVVLVEDGLDGRPAAREQCSWNAELEQVDDARGVVG
jgi:hypothetical protein